ncbi:MAG: OmpA family protein, partial [Gammaproteobacteria bacterium]|nr:OmpA family protein [Gammaproteobacteria bacterium]NIT63802.1 OmpA family protein [Gammaproteobacteria bacterium]NIY32382.1 OmpA family protein [Gammaproteobacteria bacterium]
LALSSVNFRRAYEQYRDCLADLLPVNFEQIKRSRVHFRTAQHELTAGSREKLAHIVEYVQAENTVTGF